MSPAGPPRRQALLLLLLLWACRASLPPDEAVRVAGAALDGLSTRAALSDGLGLPPRACLDLDADHWLCEWRLRRGTPRYDRIASRLGIQDQVGVLCALPRDGSPRAADACTLHQRRSNRDRLGSPGSGPESRRHSRSDRIAALRAEARRHLEGARTLLEMSRTLGQLPEQCEPVGDERACTWLLSNQSYGHGSVARSIGADPQRKIRFTCRFPRGGGHRDADSCHEEAG